MFSDFLKDLFRYLPAKVLPGVFGFISIPIMTKLLEPKEYGHYMIVISTISILSIISGDWIGNSIIRFFPKFNNKFQLKFFNGTIIGLALLSVFFIVSISYILAIQIKKYTNSELYNYLDIGLYLLTLVIIYNITLQLIVAKRKIHHYSFFNIWRQCVCILFGFFLVWYFKIGVNGMILGAIIGICLILPFLIYSSFGSITSIRFSNNLFKEFAIYGLPITVTNLSAWILELSDRYIIEFYRGSSEVGLYSISYKIAENSIMLLVTLMILASQAIVMNIWENEGAEKTSNFITNITKFYLIITIPATIGLCLTSKNVVQVLADEKYLIGHQVMPMVAISIFLFGFQRNFQLSLLFFKKTNLIMCLVLFSGILNIIANLIFVPKYGFIAAGYTTLFSYLIFSILSIIVSRRYFSWIFPYTTLVKVITATIPMSIAVIIIQYYTIEHALLSLSLSVIIGSAIYFVIIMIQKDLRKDILLIKKRKF